MKRPAVTIDLPKVALAAWRRLLEDGGAVGELTELSSSSPSIESIAPGTLVLLPAAVAESWFASGRRPANQHLLFLVLTQPGAEPLPALAAVAVAYAPALPPRGFDPRPALLALESQAAAAARLTELESALQRTAEERNTLERRLTTLGDQLEHARGTEHRAPAEAQLQYSVRRVEESMELSRRYGVPLSCLLLAVEPAPGSAEAEARTLIAQVPGQLKRNVRSTDLIAVFGADRFLVVSPFTSRRAAIALARRLRQQLQGVNCVLEINVGVADYDDSIADARALLGRVEGALERARRRDDGVEGS